MPCPAASACAPSLQGNRETARRVLQDQGVSILAGAQVTEMRMAGSGSGGGEGAAGEDEDLAKRLVYLRDSAGQQEVRAGCGNLLGGCSCRGEVPSVAKWYNGVASSLHIIEQSGPASALLARPAASHLPMLCCALQILEADLVLWSAGQAPVTTAAPPEQAPALPFATNRRGAMQTDTTLRALKHQRVFALGDIAVRCDRGSKGGG